MLACVWLPFDTALLVPSLCQLGFGAGADEPVSAGHILELSGAVWQGQGRGSPPADCVP